MSLPSTHSSMFLVCLREPVSPQDYREDPYWETGSFGCTGCHSSNLLNPQILHLKTGDRLAFAQGGDLGSRLVLITPPIKLFRNKNHLEVTWTPIRPFKYAEAPLLINIQGQSAFPKLKKFIQGSQSNNWRHKFSSKFRTRAFALSAHLSQELDFVFHTHDASPINNYLEALPVWNSWESWSRAQRPVTWAARKKSFWQRHRPTRRSLCVKSIVSP